MPVLADRTSAPVVLLGFDAADPDLVERWAREGKLPALRRMMERGAWARTAGPELLFEHGIWSSIFSGVSVSRHGFHFFWQPVPGSYGLQLKKGRDIGVSPFWGQLAGTGRSVFVMDPPDTEPIRGLPGVQVSEWATHSHYPPLTLTAEPPAVVREVGRAFGPREQIGEMIESTPAQDREMADRLCARAARKGACIRELLQRQMPDVVVAVFAESHTGAHQLWEYRRDSKGDGPRPEHGLGDGLLRLYQAVDREIGLIVDALPPTANVFVASSVGLLPQYPTEALVEAFCRQLGYQAAPALTAPTDDSTPRSLTTVLRGLIPESARNFVSRFLPLHVQERLLSEKFAASTDWSRTEAYALPGYYTGSVRVNLRGREPSGIVEPGAEYDAVLTRLENDFRALVDAENGEPVIERTVRVRDQFGGEVHPALPDLAVFWHPHDRPLRRLRHPRAELSQIPHFFNRGSHHTTSGMLIAAGPAIRAAGVMPDVNPLSLAPTLLTLLTTAVPGTMTADVLSEWLSDATPVSLDAAPKETPAQSGSSA